MRHIIISVTIAIISLNSVLSQDWIYSQHIGATTKSELRGLTIDSDTNLYVTAFHRSNSDSTLLTGPTYTKGIFINGRKQDILLIKLNQAGDTLWIREAGGTDSDYPREAAIDPDNNVYLTGIYQTSSLSIQAESLLPYDKNDIFLAKYTETGGDIWAKRVAWGPGEDRVEKIATDNLGNVYMVGSFIDSLYFDTDTLYTSQPLDTSLFVAKFNSNGGLRWAREVPTSVNGDQSKLVDISVANNTEIYLGGFFFNDLTYGGTTAFTQGANEDAILIKIDSSGTLDWLRQIGSAGLSDRCNGISTDANGTVYITGYFSGAARFDTLAFGDFGSSQLISNGNADMFLAKYNRNGQLRWKTSNGDAGDDIGYGVKVRENIIQYTGYFTGDVTFNSTTISSGSLTNEDTGFFIYDTDGNPITAHSIQGKSDDRGEYIEYDAKGYSYIGGYFASDTLFIGEDTLPRNSGTWDAFVAKYQNPFSITFSRVQQVSCPGWNNGSLTVTPYFGSFPYTYNWTPDISTDSTATGLTAGYYEVEVTDALGKSRTLGYTITDPADFNLVLDSTNVTCNGLANGTITINTINGGTTPYNYIWTGPSVSIPGDSNQADLGPGKYFLTVTDDNSCLYYDSVEIVQPDPITFSGTSATPEDPAGSQTGFIDLEVQGGSIPYSYSWEYESAILPGRTYDTLQNLSEGFYTAHVSDNNSCVADTIVLVPGEELRVDLIGTDITCYGNADGNALARILSGDKGFPFTYTFKDTFGIAIAPATDTTIINLTKGWYYLEIYETGGDNRTAVDSVEIIEPDSLIPTLTPNVISCYGESTGTIGMTVSGGRPSYIYNWSNGSTSQSIVNVPAGFYTVEVTDASGCTTIGSATVNQEDSLEVDIELAHVIECIGSETGILQANVSGGVMPYSYLWDDNGSQTNYRAIYLPDGTYRVIVTDNNNCTNTQNYTLSDPSKVSLFDADTADVTCLGSDDGHFGVTTVGGTPPYKYVWLPGQADTNYIDKLEPGKYKVVAKDSFNCASDTSYYTVKEPSAALSITENLSAHTDNNCYQDMLGELEVLSSGGWGSYTFSINQADWQKSSNFVNLPADTYTVAVKDTNGCIETASITITEPRIIQVASLELVNETNTLAVSATGGTPPYTYSLNGISNPQSAGIFNFLDVGSYFVQISDANNCGPLQSSNIDVSARVDIPNAVSSAYPNPSTGTLYIDMEKKIGGEYKVELISTNGSKVFERIYYLMAEDENPIEVNLSRLSKGVYILRVNEVVADKKIVIR